MIEDIFANLAKDINDSVQRVLSSQEVAELKKTVQSSLKEFEETVTGPARPLTPEQQARQEEMRRTQQARRAAQSQQQEELRRQQQARQEELRRRQAEYRQQQFRQQHGKVQSEHQQPTQPWTYSDGKQASGTAAPKQTAIVKQKDGLPKIRSGGAVFQTVAGSVCTALTGVSAVSSLAHTLMDLSVGGIIRTSLWGTLLGISMILLFAGVGKVKLAERFRSYRSILKGREFCLISDLSSAAKVSEKRTIRDLKKMLEKKLLPEGYFDEQQSCIILDKSTYQQYLTSRETALRRQAEAEADPQVAAMQQAQEEGSRYIWRIREINADLPEEDISLQLDKLADICQKIFSYVEAHPEKISDIRKFMSYYLPTTLKLLEAYRELDRKKIDTAEAVSTKTEIQRALGNIILAFENLYADLMKEDFLDLSADISVLETMLAQEGLMEEVSADGETPVLHV